MQPYFIPYIGYFQLIHSADKFVIYDNIQYTKKGWVTRNRLQNKQQAFLVSLPVEKSSDFVDINQKRLAASWKKDRQKIRNRISNAYRQAPCYENGQALFDEILQFDDPNLFNFIYHSIKAICHYLAINTTLMVSSQVSANDLFKGQQRVISICQSLNATQYHNAIGGVNLYDHKTFLSHGMKLNFLESSPLAYRQLGEGFIPNLSIMDLIMHVEKDEIASLLQQYKLNSGD